MPSHVTVTTTPHVTGENTARQPPESSGAWTQSPQLLALCACQAHSPLGPHDDKCHAVLDWILT